MRFRIQDNMLAPVLRAQASDEAPPSRIFRSDLLEKLKDADEPGWWFVRVVTPGAREHPEGFIRSIQLAEAEQTETEEIDEKVFLDAISFAAGRLCANQNYLFAVASAVSGLSNTTSEG